MFMLLHNMIHVIKPIKYLITYYLLSQNDTIKLLIKVMLLFWDKILKRL